MSTELPRERPVAAYVGRVDAQVQLGVRLDRMDLLQFFERVDHVPLDALHCGGGDVFARLDRIRIEDLGRRNPLREQQIELGNRGDFEPGALLEHDPDHTGIRIGLDCVVRSNAGYRRREATRFLADDAGIDQEERLVVASLTAARTFSKSRLDSGCESKRWVCSNACCRMDLMVFLATPARICIVGSPAQSYVTGISRAKKSCEP